MSTHQGEDLYGRPLPLDGLLWLTSITSRVDDHKGPPIHIPATLAPTEFDGLFLG